MRTTHDVKKIGQRRTLLTILIAASVLITLCISIPANDVLAAEDSKEIAGEIEVTVGYEGAKAYTKKIVPLADLAKDTGTHRQIYSWIDDKGACGTTEAEGIYLSDLVKNAEIDTDSIYSYQFLAKVDSDNHQELINKISDQDLYDGEAGERYTLTGAFRYALGSYQNCDDKQDYEKNPDDYFTIRDIFGADGKKEYTEGAWRFRSTAMPMIALQIKSAVWSSQIIPPTDLDYRDLKDETVPVFLYGQASKSDINRTEKLSKISTVQICFEGSPKIAVKGENLEGKTGAKGKVTVSVSTPDSTLTEKIRSEIGFVSSNESVATVDKDGNVTLTGNGTASILVTYDSDGDGKKETVGTLTARGTENSSGSGDLSGNNNGSSRNSGNGSSGSDGSGNGGNSASDESSGDTDSNRSPDTSTGGMTASSDFTPRSSTVTNTTPTTTTTGTSSGITNNTTSTDSTDPRAVGETAAAGYETDLDTDTTQKAFEVNDDEDIGSDGSGGESHKTLLMLLGGAVALVGGMIIMTYYYFQQTEEKVFFERLKKEGQ